MKTRLIFATILWAIFFVLPSIVDAGRGYRPLGWFAIESTLILLILLLLFSSNTLWNIYSAESWPRKFLVACLLSLLLLGQGLAKPHFTYPIVPWAMYTDPAPEPLYIEIVVVHETGEREAYPFRAFHPQGRVFMSRFANISRQVVSSNEAESRRVELMGDLRKLAELYRNRFPHASITSLEVNQCVIPLREYKGKESIERQPIARLELE